MSVEQLVDRGWADRSPLRVRDTLYGYAYRLDPVRRAAAIVALR
ncbi:hypothetical protein ABZ816_00325 [Actinosynnema sp. NPDC047251]|nr:hypothetical protein [Saccharothrix espanaensis]